MKSINWLTVALLAFAIVITYNASAEIENSIEAHTASY